MIVQHQLTPAIAAERRLLFPVSRQPARHRQHAGHRRRFHRAVLHHRAAQPPICRAAAAIRSAASTTSPPRRARWCRTTRRSPGISAGIIDHYQGFDIGANAAPQHAGRSSTAASTCSSGLLDNCDVDGDRQPGGAVLPHGDAVSSRLQALRLAHAAVGHRDQRVVSVQSRARRSRRRGRRRTPSSRRRSAAICPPAPRRPRAIQLIEPETLYGGYLNQLDLRLSQRFTLGRFRLRGDAKLYNVFNSDCVSSVNTTFSTTASNAFLRPTGVLQGRLFKIGGQIEF